MNVPIIQEVPPDSHRNELRGVILTALVIVGVWIGAVTLHRVPATVARLEPHQRLAFDLLLPIEQGIFNDLRTAPPEIRALQVEIKAWPDPSKLADQGLPPFVQDPAWRKRGQHTWRLASDDHDDHAVYWGRPADEQNGAEWVLLLAVNKSSVWLRKPPSSRRPSEVPQKLASEGWVELLERKNVYNQ